MSQSNITMCYNSFLINLYKYLIGIEDCNNNIIRKHNKNLGKIGEFSLLPNAWMFGTADVSSSSSALKTSTTEQVVVLLVEASKKWEFQISKCIARNNCIHIFLNRTLSYKKILENVLKQKCKYGSHSINFGQRISLLEDLNNHHLAELNLSELRLLLLKDVTRRLLDFNHSTEDNLPETSIHLSLKMCKDLKEKIIFCGSVASILGTNNCAITAEEFYRKRAVDMRLLAEHKYGLRITSTNGWQEFFEKLGQAAVTIDLLQYKPSRPITININNSMSSSNKGASFILYNCARLATLFKEFEKRVSSGVYPALPSVDQIEYCLLTEPEEWELLFVYVLRFPDVVNSCIKEILDGKICIHNLCSTLVGMCSLFSVYYRRIRILTEPRSHLSALLHARIYLLKAVEQVLHNGLFFLNIQPVKQM